MALSRAQKDRQREYHLPAPIGGINSVSSGTDMPPQDCIQSFNMIAAEYGLRSRLGWREWVTNLDGEEVRSLLPFTGSTKDGTNDKLFACTETGIWDVSASTAEPVKVVTFGTHDVDSGWGVSTVFVTLAGHFLLYTDEANGYFVYSEGNMSWTQVASAATTAWAVDTVYALGDKITNAGVSYECSKAGTSASSPATGPEGTGNSIADGTAEWDYLPAISGVDPAHLCFVMAWKNKVWFVEKDTGSGWYLDTSAIFGVAHRFQFGNRFQKGGDLRGLWSWTFDGGSGIDDALVAVSGGGDVLIYRGTDPSEAGAFNLTGVWFVGGVPKGRRLCTDNGGDLLLMSSIGILPLSTLVTGKSAIERSQYRTAKIANLFNQAQIETAASRGWAMRIHPQDACLMVLAPTGQNQFVMSLTTQGWHQYRDFPMGVCAEAWGGTLYFGTSDGRVCVNDGYLDAVVLIRTWGRAVDYNVGEWVRANGNTYVCVTAGTSAVGGDGPATQDAGITDGTCVWDWSEAYYQSIEWSMLTSFSTLGTARHKQVKAIRLRTLSKGSQTPLLCEARYGFDFAEISGSPTGGNSAGALFGTAKWGDAVWAGDYAPAVRVFGANGIGSEVAIAIKGTALARSTLVSIDVIFDVGGYL
jgi:hypothetical protein